MSYSVERAGRIPLCKTVRRNEFSMSCVFDCQHPLWGGGGVCVSNDGVPPFCLCDAGFATQDIYGDPSCVLRRAQLIVVITAAVVQWAGALFLAWHVVHHRKLPAQIRGSRRSNLHLRLGVSASIASTFLAIVCTICVERSWSNDLNGRVVPALLVIATPLGFSPCACAIEIWVDSLPSQVLALDSLEVRLKKLAEERHLFVWAGFTATIAGEFVGGTGLAFFRAPAVLRLMKALSAACAAITGCCLCFLGVRIRGVIDRAEAKVRLGSKAFYETARKNLRLQLFALCGTGAAYSTVGAVSELWNRARCTPFIPITILVTIVTLAFVLAVHFSRPTRVPPRVSAVASSPIASLSRVEARRVPGGLTSTTTSTVGIAPPPTRLVTVTSCGRSRTCFGGFTPSNTSTSSGGRKVIPTIGDDGA